MPAAVSLRNVMQALLLPPARTPPMSRPAWAVGFMTWMRSPARMPVTVKHCSAVVLAATMVGLSVADSEYVPIPRRATTVYDCDAVGVMLPPARSEEHTSE